MNYRENLMKLAVGVMNMKGLKFDMERYRGVPSIYGLRSTDRIPPEPECGTVACLLGHGPSISGLEPSEEARYQYIGSQDYDVYWDRYVKEAFGIPSHGAAWDFMFNGGWDQVDNTKAGGVARILYWLDNGTPASMFTTDTAMVQKLKLCKDLYQPYLKKAKNLRKR